MKKKIMAMCLVIAMAATAVIGGTLAYFTDTDKVANTFAMGNVDINLFETKDGVKIEDGINFEEKIVPNHVFDKDPTVEVIEGSEDTYLFLDMQINKYKSLIPLMALNYSNNHEGTIDIDAYTAGGTTSFGVKAFIDDMMKPENKAVFQDMVNGWFGDINHENWQICGYFYNVDDNYGKEDINYIDKGEYMVIRFAYIGAGNPILSEKDNVTFMTTFGMPATVTQDEINSGLTKNAFNTDAQPFMMKFIAHAIQADTIDTVEDAFTALYSTDLGEYWTGVTMGN